jgi:aspartokinase/homoserine dehydrogenase 1
MSLLTMKFGGTSVGSAEAISQVVEIVKREREKGNDLIIVVSALAGVTNALLDSAQLAIAGNRWGYLSGAEKLRERHEEAINRLLPPNGVRSRTMNQINTLIEEYIELCQAITVLGELTPRIMDSLVSFGERMSSRIVAAAINHSGVESKAYDAGEFLITDNRYQSAIPLWDETQRRVDEKLMPIIQQGITPVLTGFIGKTPLGTTTTLGRGGSDFSGAIFAAATNSDELIIWTDVDGVMTTDPRLDSRAQVLPYISYQEVGELAFYGAKVLHPKTVQPILDRGIPLRVCNTFNPDFPGTLIGPDNQPAATVIKAVTSVRNVGLLTIGGRGMIGVPGIAGRAFLTAAGAGANILMISQASSEQSFCFVVMDDQAEKVQNALQADFADELKRRDIDQIELMDDVVIVTAVGAGMRGTPGVSGRIFTCMGDNAINVIAIAQGASECSISFVIEEAHLERAIQALHTLALETVNNHIATV